MKKVFLFLSVFIVATLACDLSVTVAPPTSPVPVSTNTMIPTLESATPTPEVFIALTQAIPATVVPNPTTTPPLPASTGVEVSVDPLSIVLSPGLASGARGSQFPRAEGDNVTPSDVTPGHVQLKLEGYLLQGKSHQPQIYVYPAQGYAEMVPAAFESIHRLNNILYDTSAPISDGQLPIVPFFNAQQVFASNIQVISFQNGRGVRFLTEYAQHPASANNTDLFYHFQGVTSDGTYYIIAILPISNPMLAETSDAGAALPSGGVPYPCFANPSADMQAYYNAVASLLNTTLPDAFFPTINQLDALIQSMRITQ
jgi:hypothetical protein